MNEIISVRGLTKTFGEISAVDHLDFTVRQGEIYGFLGENGAGKSTTIRMLLSLIRPSAGEIEIFGLPLKKHRNDILKKTGAIVEKPDLYKYLPAIDNLRLFAKLSRIKLTDGQLMEQLAMVGLAARAKSRVSTFSQGMKQRLGIAVALLHNPELVILDEPLNGLDPQGIAEIRKLVKHLSKDKGKTLFISSHLLSEMEQVADSLLIIHKGKKIAEGKMNQLINPDKYEVEIETDEADRLAELLKTWSGNPALRKADKHIVVIHIDRLSIPELLKYLADHHIPVYSVRPRHNLENYFLSLTAH